MILILRIVRIVRTRLTVLTLRTIRMTLILRMTLTPRTAPIHLIRHMFPEALRE